MRKMLLITTAMLGLAAAPAMALPMIADGSTFNISGAANCSATACTFTDSTPLQVGNASVGSVSGSYVTAGFGVGDGVTMSNFTYSPFTADTVYTAFSILNLFGNEASFSVTSQISATRTILGGGTLLTIVDSGIARLTGYADTAGTYIFTQNQFGQTTGTFSASSNAQNVPEPATMALLGASLVGLGVARRRKNAA